MTETNGRNAWTERDFRRAITRAGGVITCSWGVAGLRDRKTGEMNTVVIFHDDDKQAFAHAFAFTSLEEVQALCQDLMTTALRIKNGEFKE
jgi:hypothetical protein